jgi:hypothetical protein
MKYIDADQIYKELKHLEELIPVSDGNNMNINYAEYIISALKRFIERQQRQVITSDEILRKAERDLFGSYESAAVVEAQRRYTSPYAQDCCHLISTYDIINRIQTAFVEGVIWHENEQLKEE